MKFMTKMGAQAASKIAFSLSPEGHEQDAANYREIADYFDTMQDLGDDYAKKAPVRSLLGLRPLERLGEELKKRHYAYAAKKHEKDENAYNPFGGWATPYRRKEAFAVTEEGHEYDAGANRALADALARIQDNNAKYRQKAKVRGLLTIDPGKEIAIELVKRHANYTAKKHEKGENAYNPFGGYMTNYPEE